jgi:hypothetical protein
MSDAWKDDQSFNNLAKNKEIHFRRVSYACYSLNCIDCDGLIHYRLLKEVKGFVGKMVDGVLQSEWHGQYRSAKTGKMEGEREFEEVFWDTEQESVMLEGGVVQNPINTPEGSKCECHHCHGRRGYKEWKARGGKPKPGFEPTKGFGKEEYAPGQEPSK